LVRRRRHNPWIRQVEGSAADRTLAGLHPARPVEGQLGAHANTSANIPWSSCIF